jgi:sugar/nucleoside kinase (ribokinase family)
MDHLVEKGVKLVLLTLGEAGVAGGTSRYRFIVPSFKVAQVCPTGAGDAFSASIVYNLILRFEGDIDFYFSKEDLQNLLLEAAAAGAGAVLGVGATSNVSRRTVEEIMAGQATELRNKIVNLTHP